ncbi:two-component regulator propeller domain-containing protein [Candidatus Latescibacterota bacterium]
MKRSIILIALFFCFTANSAFGEYYPNWEGFPPVYSMKDIIEFNGNIYGATKGGFLRYNPSTKEYKFYYKNHGLVSNNVLSIAAASQKIFLGFEEDGLWSFDPYSDSFKQIIFPEYHVKTSSHLDGIAVYDIFVKNDSILYIGHEEGVDRLNLHTEELRTYSNLGPEISQNTQINEVKVFNNKIWACTNLGLAVADEDNPNLEFEENWINYTYTSYYGGTAITSIINVVDAYQDTVYLGSNGSGILILNEDREKLEPTSLMKGYVYAFSKAMDRYWAATDQGLCSKHINTWSLTDESYTDLTALVPGEENRLWVGTMQNGLKSYTESGYVFIPSQSKMRNVAFYDIDISTDNSVWFATTPLYHAEGNINLTINRLLGNSWTIYGKNYGSWIYRTVSILADTKGRVWAATWGKGLFSFEDDIAQNINPSKDILRPTIADFYVVCTDLAEDRQGNIWVANHQVDPPEHAIESVPSSGAVVLDVGYGLTIDNHQIYSPADDGLPTATIMRICPDEDGWVWLGTFQMGVTGIYVGDDPFDKSDTEVHELTLDNGIHSMKINAFAYDHEGYVWVGTDGGLNRITKKSGHILIVEDMNKTLESADREVNIIEVDRFNNKWIGTINGLIKLNSKNEHENVYTTYNSGLFSNTIFSLKYDNSDDILWVGTDSGINKFDVFSGKISEGTKTIHFYPNPFEIWGYDSMAVFTNLKSGSTVRIYSFSGVLINELPVEDDSQSWNGKNFEGNYVGSGVYFFTGIDPNDRKFKDKFVVVRR